MMYFAVVLAISCALLGVQSAPTRSHLLDDLKKINSFFTRDDLVKLVLNYDHSDPEVHEIFKYFKSNEVAAIIREFGEKPQVEEFRTWLVGKLAKASLQSNNDNNVADVSDTENDDVFSGVETREHDGHITGGWRGFVKDYLELFPVQAFFEEVQKLKAEDEDLTEMWGRLAALKPVYEEFIREPQVIKIGQRLRELGVDTKQFDRIIRISNGWL